jgi:sugar lactone lactonase YvrE
MSVRIDGDAGLGNLVVSESETVCCHGFTFTEGPVWVPQDDCLLFSDIPNNRIHRWRPGNDAAEIYREPSRNSNGLTLDHDGNLLACEHSGRQVTRGPYDGRETAIATHYDGKRLNSPNDIVVHSSGAIYFTDPPYGLRNNEGDKELRFQGVYRIDPDGMLTLLDNSFTAPNGLAFSPDESTLYIGDSIERFIRRFSVAADGTISGGEVFVDMRGDERPGPPDGMKVDHDGRLWTTGTGGVWMIDPGGAVLGVMPFPENPANLAFGGPEFSMLYLTAHASVYRVETNVRGIAPGSGSV